MQHPDWEEHAARKRLTHGDWCRAGGLENFAKVGHLTDHPNYGRYHVVDRAYNENTSNCIFCGKEIDGL